MIPRPETSEFSRSHAARITLSAFPLSGAFGRFSADRRANHSKRARHVENLPD